MSSKYTITFFDLLKLSLRIFKTKPMRTFLTILGMSVGISTVVFLVSFGYGLQYILIGKLVSTEDSLITLSATYPTENGLGINFKKIEDLKTDTNIAEISPVAEFPGEIKVGSLTGIIPIIRVVEASFFRLSGTNPDMGRPFIDRSNEIVLSSQALLLMGMKADETTLNKKTFIKIYSQKTDGTTDEIAIPKEFTIVGIMTDDQQPPLAIIPASSISLQMPSYKELLIKASSIDTVEILRDTLEKQGFLISARIDLVTQARKITNIITTILAVFGVTALVVSAIGMFNTMLIGFIERTYEVGVMKSIGATDATVRNLFLAESAVIGFLGGGGGILIGWGLGKEVNFVLNIMAQKMGGKSFELFILPMWFGFTILILSITIGLSAGFWPAIRAAKLSPREAFVKK
jgi:ABC-type antimicrobial peptide transport system permease subunit